MKRLTPKQKERRKRKQKEEREKRMIKRLQREKYKNFIDSIKQRDNNTCQVCLKPENKVMIMHILSQENYPELRMDENNVLMGCYSCHKGGYGKKISFHLDGFAFSNWFMMKFPKRYEYLINKLGVL